jgi:glycolate oxidase iron-sulfur subunit
VTEFKIDKDQLSQDLLKCGHCGMCLPVCPVYRETLIETDSPRARLALIKARENGSLEEKPGYVHKIFNCITCMACSQACPSGVHADELVSDARTRIRKKPLPLQQFVTNRILSYPSRLRRLIFPLRVYQKSGARYVAKQSRLLNIMPQQFSRFDSMLPEMSGSPVYRGQQIEFKDEKEAKHKVGYFPGCAQNLVFTSVTRATIQVLLKNDCQVTIPERVVCCGMPHIGYGEIEEAKKLARQNIDAFNNIQVDYIITDCATCGSSLKNYASLLAGDPNYTEKARLFSQKVRDIAEFLMLDISLNRNFHKTNVRVTYHEPCHLGRGQSLKEAPRRLLREIVGDRFVEMNEADACCGGGGSYTITHRKLSMKILDRKMKNLKDSQAEVIVTGCPGCEIQLSQGIARSHQKVRLKHIIELLAEAYSSNRDGE